MLAGTLQTAATIVFAGLLAHVLHALIILGRPFDDVQNEWWMILACVVIRALAGAVREEVGIRISLSVRRAVRETLLDTLYRLGPAWRERQQAGALSTALLEQVEALDGYFARYRPQQWFAVLTPLMIVAVLLPSSWVAALILLLTAPLIPLLVGHAHEGAVRVLRMLAWLPLLQVGRSLLNFHAIHHGHMRHISWACIFGGGVSVCAVAALVPAHGMAGAVIASYIAEITMSLALLGLAVRASR